MKYSYFYLPAAILFFALSCQGSEKSLSLNKMDLSKMLGCKVIYQEDSAPQVIQAGMVDMVDDPEAAFKSNSFKRYLNLRNKLKAKYGYITGDIKWSRKFRPFGIPDWCLLNHYG
jgi:hypothetical protein